MTSADKREFYKMKLTVTGKVSYSWMEQFSGFPIR